MNLQETIANVSENSNECDNPERMQKLGTWYGHVQKMQGSGVQLKESVGQSSCFVPHAKRLHNSTFNSQPVTPLISLTQIQDHILSHSDIERRRLQYDNAWDILENEDSKLSNHYRPSVTTKQSNTSYVFVGSVQKASREVKSPPTSSSCQTDDTSKYSGDTEDYKPKSKKSCSMKKICKYILLILIFLGISAVIAMSTVYYQDSQTIHSNSMEAQRVGNNDINKTHTSVLEKLDSIKKSIESIKIFSEDTNTYVNSTNNLPNQTSPGYSNGGSGTGVQCLNSTNNVNNVCVNSCVQMCDMDYQSCETCEGYVTCSNEKLDIRICSKTSLILYWDDILKACEHKSSTCNMTKHDSL
uniref:Uncharacterized protein n=1 Tax=Magallana gigas TaxID=29159 RepID=A0A8W8NLC8_MAGGI